MCLTRNLMLMKTTTTKYLYYNVHKGGFATNGATRLFIFTSPGSKQVSLTQDCIKASELGVGWWREVGLWGNKKRRYGLLDKT